jgi:hypothetical protein
MKQVRHIFLAILLFNGASAFAQIHEYGVFSGVTDAFGSLNNVASFKQVRPGAGAFYRYNIGYRGAWRTSFNWGLAQFDDNTVKDAWNLQRNLSYRTNIFDVSTMIEFNFFKYDKESKKHWYTPYIATGLTLFFFNPQAEFKGVWYYLQPLGTEGQNNPNYSGVKKYHLYNFAIPLVGGFKCSFARFWNIAIEAALRQTFTKYLDDVSGKYPSFVDLPAGSGGLAAALSNRSGQGANGSQIGYQRGDGVFDKYLFLGITVSYTIMRIRCPTISGAGMYR